MRVIAREALRRKDCHTPDRRVFKQTRLRITLLLDRLDRKGFTCRVGGD